LTLKLHLFKTRRVQKNTALFLFVFCFFSVLKLQAQLGFCSGNSGDPIFTETFGTGTNFGPSLPTGNTEYTFVSNSGPQDGQYTIANNTFSYGWSLPNDHTPNDSNGKCFIVNADFSQGEFYRRTVNGLCETTTYEFSSWLINILPSSGCGGSGIPVNVSFEIWDGTNTNLLASGDTGNIPGTSTPIWKKYGLVFQTSTGQSSVILKMINNGQGGCGNDLAIDDIEFKSCGDLISVSDSSGNNNSTLCSSQTPIQTTLTANPDFSVYKSHFYQWQESLDGLVWTDIGSETNQSLPISITTSKYYRSKVAEVAVNLNNIQCIALSDVYRIIVNQAPSLPLLQCWQTATFNVATCSWDITGTQPVEPTTPCWETATFNNTTCAWEIAGSQPIQPSISCWESVTFNTTTCVWDVTGTQPVQPNTECWETPTFNTATCLWEVTGTQPVEPNTECWETATFNNNTCSWDVTGTQPVQPNTECWETPAFNTATCLWDVTGSQPIQPNTECWETATFNTSTCSWNVTGMQPIQPPATNCWDDYQFNINSCGWENLGTQPGTVYTENLVFCNGASLTLHANTSLTNPMYLWSTGETTEFIIVNTPNVYSVEMTTPTCFFETRIFNVTQAAIPSIDTVTSDGRNIIVTTSNTGDFLYSLDGNIYQSSNTFMNINGGLYTIYVKERNCPDTDTITYLHFYIPKFFTPNNDGENDTFNLKGIEFYGESQVSVFDRYGKLLKNSRNSSFEWNGTFNNQLLPTGDYWYVIIIDNQKFTGHFTLKR
jgi:gliding motility-associated-like protein